jgi:O-succinylbenzoic acid--CoA ligase
MLLQIPDGRLWTAQQLVQVQDFSDIEEVYVPAFIFCRAWLQGQKHFVLATSGSTGIPKSIELTREQMEASAKQTLQALQLDSGYKALLCLNTAYIAGIMMLVRGLVAGHAHLLLVPPSARPFADVPEEFQPDFVAMVPLQVQKTLAEGTPQELEKMRKLKALLIGGAPLDATTEQYLRQWPAPVWASYGMTETVSHIALRAISGPEASGVFRTLSGIELNTRENGCLSIKGAVTRHEWVHTNDVVTLHTPNTFTWQGRADFVINSGGVKIFPESIERTIEAAGLTALTGRSILISSRKNSQLGEEAVLVIEGEAFTPLLEAKLMADLKTLLPPYQAPRHILYLENFPRGATAKIDRMRLKELIS